MRRSNGARRGALRPSAMALTLLMCSSGAVTAADYFGAIAISPSTLATGWSYDHPSRARAESMALDECGAHAADCQIATWFKNGCGAVATADGRWFYGWSGNKSSANARALDACGDRTNCTISAWSCTRLPSGSDSYVAPYQPAPPSAPAYTPPTYTCPPGLLVNGHQCY